MPVINNYNSPQFLGLNNENDVSRRLIAKQVVSSVKPKKKALLDVGNTIHQQKQTYSEGKKMDGNWKMEKTTIIGPKTKSSVCSPALTSSDDLIDDHNWSVCEKYLQDENDGFLPNFQLTPQQINSYALDWDVKPPASKLQLREMGWMEIEEPKSPDWWSLNSSNQWFDDNLKFIAPIS